MVSEKQTSRGEKRIVLKKKERKTCEKISSNMGDLNGKRARALLEINEGRTNAETAEISGLTVGQIRYLLKIFTEKRLDIFPEEVLKSSKPDKKTKKKTKSKKTVKEKYKKSKKKKDKKKK